MLRCEHCKVDLPDNPSRCPLCMNVPSGTADSGESRYPLLFASKGSFSQKVTIWVAFVSVCAALISVAVNLVLPANGWWFIFVIAGIGRFWTDFVIMAKKSRNMPKSIIWQAVLVIIIAFIWDFATGFNGWSVDFVFPILCTCSMVATIFIAWFRKFHIQDYIFYLILSCILGIVPFILTNTLPNRMIIPSVICFVISMILLLIQCFFHGRAMLSEIQRRLHL